MNVKLLTFEEMGLPLSCSGLLNLPQSGFLNLEQMEEADKIPIRGEFPVDGTKSPWAFWDENYGSIYGD
jgi:hypothetical protein